ncbi:uncharacterized protein BXZ73DRAFT_57418 [Epithele typhae]|uniref:uncharacterized protein n=1 Tax=Epithele typhae TaxID=378194 RepID=UPI0020087096|nr:uncharacterized protein BXZ73DRAFT_57418 [Epithele typhae]KAH9910965.1 hypothetical protein BXZ73DRAFT_57418 [Epithele typhae]
MTFSANQDINASPTDEARKAGAPFNREDADFTIITRDHVDFYVHRSILSVGSQFFDGMFTVPQPRDTDPIPASVHVVEDSTTIDVFLRLLYPSEDYLVTSLDIFVPVLEAGRKFEARKILSTMRRQLLFPCFLNQDPLRVFAIACRFDLENEAAIAAVEAVVTNRVMDQYCADLDEIAAGSYYRLLALNRKTREVLPNGALTVDTAGVAPFCERGPSVRSLVAVLEPGMVEEETTAEFNAEVSRDLPPDLELQTADGHSFFVHKTIITLASSRWLSNLAEQDTHTTSNSSSLTLPVYRMREGADVVLRLLEGSYPSHTISDPGASAIEVFRAAAKYNLTKVAWLMLPSLRKEAASRPLELYFIAAGSGLRREAQAFAYAVVRKYGDATSISKVYVPEMEDVRTPAFRDLLLYATRCLEAAAEVDTVNRLPRMPRAASPAVNNVLAALFPESLELHNPPMWLSDDIVVELKEAVVRREAFSRSRGGLRLLLEAESSASAWSYGEDVYPSSERRLEWALAFLEKYAQAVDVSMRKRAMSVPTDQAAPDPPTPVPIETRKAQAPFDREDTDLIIRTSDHVDFYVHRLVLSLGSGFFESMLTLPQAEDTDPVRPCVDVVEDSATIDPFLRLLYPSEDHSVASFETISRVIEAGRKFDSPKIIGLMRRQLLLPCFLDKDPLRVFAIACHFDLEDEAEVAAVKAVVAKRVTDRYCVDLDWIAAGSYHRLLALNRKIPRVVDGISTVDTTGLAPFCRRGPLSEKADRHCNGSALRRPCKRLCNRSPCRPEIAMGTQ